MKRNKGFSLIELLVAITLLAIIMIMVTQFMSTSTGALSRTKRNLNLQTQAMELGNQFSDTIMQATYIRVFSSGSRLYTIDNQLAGDSDAGYTKNRKKRQIDQVNKDLYLLYADLASDNYPNYGNTGGTERKIIIDTKVPTGTIDDDNRGAFYSFFDESGSKYPHTGDGIDKTNGKSVKSFRLLTSDETVDSPYYVQPRFVYVRYKKKVNGVEEANESYAMYQISPDNSDPENPKFNIYVVRGSVDSLLGGMSGDGFVQAVEASYAMKGGAEGENGLLASNVKDFYISADPEENVVYMDFNLQDERYKQYSYNYVETINLRNTYALTVPPQKMYKKK